MWFQPDGIQWCRNKQKWPSRGIEWKCASAFVENSPLDACHWVVTLHTRRTPQSVITWWNWQLEIWSSTHVVALLPSFPNSFFGLFSRWIHEMNPKVLGDVPSGLPGYLPWSLSLCRDVFWSYRGSGAFLPPILGPIPSWPSASPSILHPWNLLLPQSEPSIHTCFQSGVLSADCLGNNKCINMFWIHWIVKIGRACDSDKPYQRLNLIYSIYL